MSSGLFKHQICNIKQAVAWIFSSLWTHMTGSATCQLQSSTTPHHSLIEASHLSENVTYFPLLPCDVFRGLKIYFAISFVKHQSAQYQNLPLTSSSQTSDVLLPSLRFEWFYVQCTRMSNRWHYSTFVISGVLQRLRLLPDKQSSSWKITHPRAGAEILMH